LFGKGYNELTVIVQLPQSIFDGEDEQLSVIEGHALRSDYLSQ